MSEAPDRFRVQRFGHGTFFTGLQFVSSWKLVPASVPVCTVGQVKYSPSTHRAHDRNKLLVCNLLQIPNVSAGERMPASVHNTLYNSVVLAIQPFFLGEILEKKIKDPEKILRTWPQVSSVIATVQLCLCVCDCAVQHFSDWITCSFFLRQCFGISALLACIYSAAVSDGG